MKLWHWCMTLFGVAAVTVTILMPSSMVPSSHFNNQDKVEHIIALAMLGSLWMVIFPRPFYVLLAGFFYGISTEVLQKWMAVGRNCDPLDVLADAVGTLIGVGIMSGLAKCGCLSRRVEPITQAATPPDKDRP